MLKNIKIAKNISPIEQKRIHLQEKFITMTKRQDNSTPSDIIAKLSPISDLLTEEQKAELQASVVIKKYKKNEIMYEEGDVPQYLHCLISGKVKIYKEGVGGRNQIVHIFKPVEFFGFRAYMANENYITSAAAFEPTTLCIIPVTLFEKWLSENLQLANYVIRLCSVEIGILNRHIVSLTQKHLRGRIAESLLFLKETYGMEEDNQTISARFSRADLADLSNMTTSNAIRTLSAFSSENILEVNGRKIKILDENQLKKISKIG